ncbi:MAG TPA: OFA family MFS transporter [Caulobacteraceae bacterium]|jgi:MFS family permease
MTRTWVESPAGVGLLSPERILVRPGFNRWLLPPAALAIQLSLGMAYGFSVFWLPMGRLLSVAPACHAGFIAELTATDCNWTVASVAPIFGLFIAMTGLSSAVLGHWVEQPGPRTSGFVAAACWGGGLLIGAVGVEIHQLWLVFLGVGLIGGIGQGLGYVTPLTTLIRWFPDRRGMATGFSVMGYGGGAMIASPLAAWLMSRLSGENSPGVAPTLAILGCIYFVAMSLGAIGLSAVPTDRPGSEPLKLDATITHPHPDVNQACKSPQFWLLWTVLSANIAAGLALISMASPMFQDIFGGQLVGLPRWTQLDPDQKARVAVVAAGLVGLIGLFNSLGRLFWASVSDRIGRTTTYSIFLAIGAGLYACLPSLAHQGLAAAFMGVVCLIVAVYGGGLATLPAYLADVFGARFVSSIHGRVIIASSVASVIGPALIASLRQSQLHAGLPRAQIYDTALYAMAVLMLVGLASNLLMRPVADAHRPEELAEPEAPASYATSITVRDGRLGRLGVASWLAVGIPFALGLVITLQKAAALL